MGSTLADIEAAMRMDKDGDQFPLHDETPQFTASTPAFYLGAYAVTNAQFARFLSETHPAHQQFERWMPWVEQIVVPENECDSYFAVSGFERHPAVNASWFGAEAYCHWAGLRLPTEIEWEKAARGGDGRIFPWGNEWDGARLCWWGSHDGRVRTAPVDAFPEGCSPHGIFQMAGNTEEWCVDAYQHDVYQRYANGDLHTPRYGIGKIVRGGNCLRKHRLEFRSTRRRSSPATLVNILLTGIRVACDIGEVATAEGNS